MRFNLQITKFTAHRWFHGELQPGETERLLKNKPVGKFLVRMECGGDEASLVLCRVAPPKTFAQPSAAAGAAPAATAKAPKNIILNKKISLQRGGNEAQYVPMLSFVCVAADSGAQLLDRQANR